MSSEDGANFEAKPPFSKHPAENAHGGASCSFNDAGCGNSSHCDSPWDPWSLLQNLCSQNRTREFPGIDGLVDDCQTFSGNLHVSSALNQNIQSVVDNSTYSVNLDNRINTDQDNIPLLDLTAVFDQSISSECCDLHLTNLGPIKYSVVEPNVQHARDKSVSSNLLPAQCHGNVIPIAVSIRYPFEIFSEGNTTQSNSEEECSLFLSGNERSNTSEETRNCSEKLKVLGDMNETKRKPIESSLPFHVKSSLNKNTNETVFQTEDHLSDVSDINYLNSNRQQPKQSGLPVFQKLDHPHNDNRVANTRSDLKCKNPPIQSENQIRNVQYNISGLASVNKTERLSSSVENSRFNSETHYLITSNPQTNPFKYSTRKPGSEAVSETSQCYNSALPPRPSINYDSDRLQHHSTETNNLRSSTNNNLRPQSHSQEHAITNKRDNTPVSLQRNTESTLHNQEHLCLSPCVQSASIKQTKFSAVSQSSAPPPLSSDKCCQDQRCASSRPHPDTGKVVVAVSDAKHALNRNTSHASSSSALQGMAGQNHHHLNRTVLDESAPRVPVHPPPLDNSDVMGVPDRDVDGLLFQDQQRTSSLSTSFADLMLGDHTALRHKGRDGRLGRCGESRDSTRLYGLSEAATIASLRETVLALQLQNTQLGLCLQQERSRREQAESLVDQEKGYIKRLEDTIQTLKSTRLVIDPNMYRQIAESYIASRKTPVRRTCSSSQQRPGQYEDLVCDSSSDNSLSPSPTSPNSTSSLQFINNDATRPTGSNSTYTSPYLSSSTCANDSLATLPPLPSTSTSRLPSQTPIFNERQDLRWPSERRETGSSADNYPLGDKRSASNSRKDTLPKKRDV